MTVTAHTLEGNKIRDEIESELLDPIADLKRAGVTPGEVRDSITRTKVTRCVAR
jgi:hypothetical protein